MLHHSADMIPAIAEPFFQGSDANVEIHPVMSLDDPKEGYSTSECLRNKWIRNLESSTK